MSKVGEGGCSAGILDVRINLIKCVFSPGCTLDMLVKFGENNLEACFVKVPSNDVHALQMSHLLFTYHELKLARCCANVSMGRDVNNGYYGNR